MSYTAPDDLTTTELNEAYRAGIEILMVGMGLTCILVDSPVVLHEGKSYPCVTRAYDSPGDILPGILNECPNGVLLYQIDTERKVVRFAAITE